MSRNASSSPSSAGCSLGLLLPVALEPGVRLPERHRLLVRRAVVPEVRRGGRLELLFARAVSDALGPLAQTFAQLGEVPLDVVGDAEVDQREPLRAVVLDLVEARAPGVRVELGRRR